MLLGFWGFWAVLFLTSCGTRSSLSTHVSVKLENREWTFRSISLSLSDSSFTKLEFFDDHCARVGPTLKDLARLNNLTTVNR